MPYTKQRADLEVIGKLMLYAADDDPNPAIVIDPVSGNIYSGTGSSAPSLAADLDPTGFSLADGDLLNFGTGDDVAINWTGSLLQISPVADDTGSINIGDGTTDIDFKWYGGSATNTVLFDVGNAQVTFEACDLHLGDTDFLEFGDATAGDVSINWTGAILQISPAVDDTGTINIGDGTADIDFKWYGGAAADNVLFDVGNKAIEVDGDMRIDLSGCTIAAANTDGGVIKAGTSVARVTEDTANMKFMSFYWDNGATSGDSQGLYNRLYITGAAGGGDALRSFLTVEDVAAATVRGAHISLSFGTSGSCTGLGTALETTLHIPSGGGLAGTVSSIKAAINSDGAASDPAGSQISVFNVVNQGDATGMADVDDDCVLFDFQGWGVATGDMLYDSTGGAPANTNGSIKIRLPSGALAYLMYYDAQAA